MLASEEAAQQLTDKPVWIQGVGWNLDTAYWTNRDLAFPEYVENAARMAYEMAGINEPRKEIHIAEPYDPFDYKELHHLEGLLLFDKGKAPEAAPRRRPRPRRETCPSARPAALLGVGNPIAAAGLMKIAELFWQLRGEAGARQVPGHAQARRRAGVGRPDAGGHGRRDGKRGRPPTTATQLETPPLATPGHVALRRRVPFGDGRRRRTRSTLGYAWDAGVAIGRSSTGSGRAGSSGASAASATASWCRRGCSASAASAPPTRGRRSRTPASCRRSRSATSRWDMQPLDEPELPAVIPIDGSDGGFLHMLGEVKPDDVKIGMKVEAVWKPVGERTGSILDIAYFRPTERRLMLEKIARPEEIRRWDGDLPVRHRYTPGVAGDAFFTALKDRGVLLGSRCEHCSYTYVPARLFCERCFAELSADTEVGPGGELVSFTIVFQGIEGEPLERPETIGAVRLDGADAVLIHRVLEPGEEPLEIGERVEVVVRPDTQRTGSILDIEGFRVSG